MAGSTFGNLFRITTWGESHGKGIGVVVDGCPSNLYLTEEMIQQYLDRRKPGTSKFTTPRKESDSVSILSGILEHQTTGCPISLVVMNESQRSHDYSEIKEYYRPGHADYTFDAKYGFRDYRGGGRSSGRETIGRVAGGAIAAHILKELGITVTAYTKSIGPISINYDRFSIEERDRNAVCMPDKVASGDAEAFLSKQMEAYDSTGGVVECVIKGLPAGIGEPVFDKLDANLAKAMLSIGAVKGFEIGSGFQASTMAGSEQNDSFYYSEDQTVKKRTNHAGGVLGGISDGSDVVFRVAFKPTPSIFREQETVNRQNENIKIQIKGRHDPIIVPRAVVVVETMAASCITDLLFANMTSNMNKIKSFYENK